MSSRLLGGRVDHAVVGDHDDAHVAAAASRAAARPAASTIDELQLPRRGRDAVAVAGPVEVAVVHVGQRRLGARGREHARPSARRPCRRRRTRRRAARDGQPGLRRTRACSRPWCARPAAASRPNAVGCGCHSRGSTDLLHISALSSSSVPGIREVKPTTPCAAGRQRGAERGQAGGGGRRHADGGGRLLAEQRVQERRLVGVVAQQLVAEAVDEEDDVGRAPRAAPATSAGRPGVDARARGRPRAARRPASGPRRRARRSRTQTVVHPAVRADRASAKPSRLATASGPSAAALTRSEKSSAVSSPV